MSIHQEINRAMVLEFAKDLVTTRIMKDFVLNHFSINEHR